MAKIRNMGGNQSNQKKCSFYSKMFWLMTLLCILDFAFWIYPIAFAPESFDRKIAFVIFAVTACFLRFLQKYSAGNTVFCIQAWPEKRKPVPYYQNCRIHM